MEKTTRYLLILCIMILLGCSTNENQNNSKTNSNDDNQSDLSTSTLRVTNYAVVWAWATNDTNLVVENSQQISDELTELWQSGIVENAYYDANALVDKLDYFPNITFFIKAENEAEAQKILNQLTVVQKSIARYQLYPVGPLWLDRKTETIREKGLSKSYVAIWTTRKSPFDESVDQNLLQEQNDTILNLWRNGSIENVYFDFEGTQIKNAETDFVFFVNADSESEAKLLCESLPFFKSEIATYELFQVGVFWMGKYKEQ